MATISEMTVRGNVRQIKDANARANIEILTQDIAPEFDPEQEEGYKVGQFTTYNGAVYRFVNDHSGAWSSGDVVAVNLGDEIDNFRNATKAFKSEFFDVTEGIGKNLIDTRYFATLNGDVKLEGTTGFYGKASDLLGIGHLQIHGGFKENTAYSISYSAYNENADPEGNGIRIRVFYTDGTTDNYAGMPRSASEYAYTSGHTNGSKTIAAMIFDYGTGGSDVWHVKDFQIEEGSTPTEFESFNPSAIDGYARDLFVTPQMFGAVGDGVTDDTDAIQKAIDSGYHVSIPCEKYQAYHITRTLVVTKPYQHIVMNKGYSFVMSTNYVWNCLRFTPSAEDENPLLFDIRTHDIMLIGITAECVNPNSGNVSIGTFARGRVYDDSSNLVADVDLTIRNCHILRFDYAVAHFGRGLQFEGNGVSFCNHAFLFRWEIGEGTIADENDILEHRAFIIRNNRFHVMRNYLIYLRSGYANALLFENNIIDMGYGAFIFSDTSDARMQYWNITGNTFHMLRYGPTINAPYISMDYCTFANNVLDAVKKRWSGNTDERPTNFMIIKKMVGCLFDGNSFSGFKGTGMIVGDARYCTISNNNFLPYFFDNSNGNNMDENEDLIVAESDAFIDIKGTAEKCIINGNNSGFFETLIKNSGTDTAVIEDSVIRDNIYGTTQIGDNIELINCRIDE